MTFGLARRDHPVWRENREWRNHRCRGSCRQRCAALLNRWRRAGKGDKNAPLGSPNYCAGENSVVELAAKES